MANAEHLAIHNKLRLIKARRPKILSALDFIDDKGLDNQFR
jgi:hypothetical protein